MKLIGHACYCLPSATKGPHLQETLFDYAIGVLHFELTAFFRRNYHSLNPALFGLVITRALLNFNNSSMMFLYFFFFGFSPGIRDFVPTTPDSISCGAPEWWVGLPVAAHTRFRTRNLI
ncbi:hypothetical protein SLEP1_g8790 [Rubroshorea leprosula]|uniref:Uncharacterized protein n=1 Tax=Rubroshorea leprosula TaxID=152421 RepID=A0AAV5IDS4_9ROSI|nr:hypothetical protein SLEP1_g8790 [Rubroshorea leprosula]